MENRSSSRLADWLNNLARESWQLELIISGFAIFLLVGIYDPLTGIGDKLERLEMSSEMQNFVSPPYMIAISAWFILLVNLCIHVFFRGLWISTIGLRSVSDDIDFESLRLQSRFDQFLRREVGSFDRYIERLEKVCSVLFAFTFLVLFMLLALGGMILLMTTASWILGEWLDLRGHFVFRLINFLLIGGGFIYFLDFVSLSYLKRIRWLRPVYYPIYRFYGLVTFARLYRPIYYNLIDNAFGRRVGLLLVPYILFLAIATSISYRTGPYFPERPQEAGWGTAYYDDQRPEGVFLHGVSIPSRYVDNGFIEVFLPYDPSDDDKEIKALCPELPTVKSTGPELRGVIKIQETRREINLDSTLMCLSGIHRIFVNDSLHADPGARFHTHAGRDKDGLLAILDIAYLPRGEHLLSIENRHADGDTVVWEPYARIAFWKE